MNHTIKLKYEIGDLVCFEQYDGTKHEGEVFSAMVKFISDTDYSVRYELTNVKPDDGFSIYTFSEAELEFVDRAHDPLSIIVDLKDGLGEDLAVGDFVISNLYQYGNGVVPSDMIVNVSFLFAYDFTIENFYLEKKFTGDAVAVYAEGHGKLKHTFDDGSIRRDALGIGVRHLERIAGLVKTIPSTFAKDYLNSLFDSRCFDADQAKNTFFGNDTWGYQHGIKEWLSLIGQYDAVVAEIKAYKSSKRKPTKKPAAKKKPAKRSIDDLFETIKNNPELLANVKKMVESSGGINS